MAIPAKNKIRGTQEFARIFRSIRPFSSEHLSVRVRNDASSTATRYSVTISAKVAPTAVLRSRARRVASEAVRRIMRTHVVGPGITTVFSVKRLPLPAGKMLEHEVLILMEKSGILSR